MDIWNMTIFTDKNKGLELKYTLQSTSYWPISLKVTEKESSEGITIHMKEENFINLKNDILSIDRQLDEIRKEKRNAKISEGLTDGA